MSQTVSLDENFVQWLQDTYKELHRHPESYSILDAETGRVLYSSGAARPAM